MNPGFFVTEEPVHKRFAGSDFANILVVYYYLCTLL